MNRKLLAASVAALFATGAAQAEIAVSANDNKAYLDNGVSKVVANPPPDTVTVIDLSSRPPKVRAEIPVPTSLVGPPQSVAVTADESLAFVTAAQRIDPFDPTKSIAYNRLTMIDLKDNPPAILDTVEAGAGASGVTVNRQGTMVLVANRNEGTVSAFRLEGRKLASLGKVSLGDAKSGPSAVVFTPDGKRALVTRDGDHTLSILAIDGDKVTDTKRDFGSGYRPYGADITPDGKYAVVANIGRNVGDVDTMSLVDLAATPPRTVDLVAVGHTPEGIILSPDGKTVAVVTHNGSAKPKNSPLYNPQGKVVLYRLDNGKFSRLAEAPIGVWSQGAAFSKDGKTLLVQNLVEREIQVFSFDGTTLKDTGQRLKTKGGPAAIRTAVPRP